MEQSRQAQMNNYKAFGRRPGNRNLTVEKAKDKKGTLKRLIAYFAAEKAMIIGLLAAVIVVVICSVYAPKLQSNAIDIIASGRFKELTPILITMVVVYIIHSICTFLQTKISAVLSQNIVKKMICSSMKRMRSSLVSGVIIMMTRMSYLSSMGFTDRKSVV